MKKYRDEIAMVCHEMMKAGQSIGAVSETEMQEFEKNCFVTDPEESSTALVPAAPDYASV
ncbi:hypothetical protein FACS1894164_16700 [Spirochaetia bacterium]|nr:hypothetical protein FACS1894164_16700 [Spirochaetia bacterium]